MDHVLDALTRVLVEMGVEGQPIRLERPNDPDHGDLATNVALTLASKLRKQPRSIAEEIMERLDLDESVVSKVEVAGPGFLNFHFSTLRSCRS